MRRRTRLSLSLAAAGLVLTLLLAGGGVNPVEGLKALARLSFLHAITADREGSRAAAEKHAAAEAGREIPFVDSWDRLYLGWAASARGDHEAGRALVETAAAFFRRHQLLPALSLASFVLAEMRLLEGEPEAAAALAGARAPGNDLTRVLWPLLEARSLLDGGESVRAAALLDEVLQFARHWKLAPISPRAFLELQDMRNKIPDPNASSTAAAVEPIAEERP